MKKMKALCCLCMGMLLMSLSGCSGDDDKDEMEYYYDWREGPNDFYIIKRLGQEETSSGIRITASIVSNPDFTHEQWMEYGNPPLGSMDTHLQFDVSDLAGEYSSSTYCPILIKKYRQVVLHGLQYGDSQLFTCVVEPYYGADEDLEGVKGTITDMNYNGLKSISYEQDSQKCLALVLNLESTLQAKEGQEVTFSGRVLRRGQPSDYQEELGFKKKCYLWLTSIATSIYGDS